MLNALYSHRQYELNAFIKQIQPKLLIGSRQHEVFSNNQFIDSLHDVNLSPEIILMLNHQATDFGLLDWIETPAETFVDFHLHLLMKLLSFSCQVEVREHQNLFHARIMTTTIVCEPVPRFAV